jgi:hypothetical protein
MVDVATPAAAGLRYPVEPDEKYKASVMFKAKGGKSAGQCSLYLPEAVNFSDGIVYDNTNLGVAGNIAFGAAEAARENGVSGKALSDLINKADAQATNGLSSMDTLGSDPKALLNKLGSLASLGIQGIAAEEIRAGVAAGSLMTANPHKRSVFRDVALRTFSFSFLMSPQSSAESSSIENIVDFFRENAYPDRLLGGEGYGYNFPTKFSIEFFYRGGKMSQAPKILPCYLTSVNTVINPRSASFFSDGKANEVQLSMSFQEERALDATDVRGGY